MVLGGPLDCRPDVQRQLLRRRRRHQSQLRRRVEMGASHSRIMIPWLPCPLASSSVRRTNRWMRSRRVRSRFDPRSMPLSGQRSSPRQTLPLKHWQGRLTAPIWRSGVHARRRSAHSQLQARRSSRQRPLRIRDFHRSAGSACCLLLDAVTERNIENSDRLERAQRVYVRCGQICVAPKSRNAIRSEKP
jgi:hypothetical protein